MNRIGVTVVAALALLGGIGGYAVSHAMSTPTESARPGAPAVATPAQPDARVIPVRADPTEPALPANLPMTESSLVSGKWTITYPVPAGWREAATTSDMRKYKPPGYGEDTYVLRVRDVRSTWADLATSKQRSIEALNAEHYKLRVLNESDSMIEFSYVSIDDNQARHGFRAWLDLDDDEQADIEFNINGREVDALGGAALLERLVTGTRRES